MSKNCEMCGTQNPDGAELCTACGSPMGAGGARPKSAGDDAKARTMLMTAPQAAAKAPPAAAAKPAPMRTVLGMPAVGGAQPVAKPVPVKPQPAQPAKAQPAAQPAAAAPAKAAGKPADDKRTVLGMVAVTSEMLPPKKSGPPMARVSGAPPAQQPPVKPVASAQRTVLGMAAAGLDSPPSEQEPPAPQAAGQQTATLEMERKPDVKPEEHAPRPAEAAATAGRADEWQDEEEEPARTGRSPALVIGIAAAGAVVVIAVAVILYLLLRSGGPDVEPQVFRTPDGTAVSVTFAFPNAPPGAVVQVAGQNVAVTGGKATVNIPMAQLALGANTVQLLYTEPGKTPEQMSFPIVLRHSVGVDLGGLAAENPFVTVGFKLAPGIQLAVEGKPVQVVDGAYAHKMALADLMAKADPSTDNLIHTVSFQITGADNTTEQGQHVVSIPITKLQIDRPAASVEVASDSITCAGVTESGAAVAVNGKAVGVTAVGFNTSVPLSSMGVHEISVTARAPGKAPRTQVVSVTRIESLDSAIAEWSKDLDPKLDYPALGRDPNALMDKKIRLNGRVVNISTEKGVTAFLLYIADGCPSGARCAVYVVFRGETDAGLQSWVDVYGAVRGTRAVDLPSGQKLEVPSVEAKFVVKGEQPKAKKGRRR